MGNLIGQANSRNAEGIKPRARHLSTVITAATFIVVAAIGDGLDHFRVQAQNEPEFIDWQAAQREGSRDGYDGFLKLWPNSRYAPEAARKFRLLDQAEDGKVWRDAVSKGTKEAYERYLQKYPNGTSAGKATQVIAELAAAQPLSYTAESQLQALGEFRECPNCPRMIVISGGEFLMGSSLADISDHNASDNEGPQHKVSIGYRFTLGKYEVTFAEWDACALEVDAEAIDRATKVGGEVICPS
jgi:hypothetical protein